MDQVTESREERLDAISAAIDTLLSNPHLKRLDGEGWRAYRVGVQIRVDVDNHAENEKVVQHG